MDEKKMQELMNDEEFVKQVISLKTEEEVQEAFKAKGVDISIEEIKKLGEEGKTALKDDPLENVSGGGLFDGFWHGLEDGLYMSPVGAGQWLNDEDVRPGTKVGNVAGSLVIPIGCAVCGAMIYRAVEKRKNKSKEYLTRDSRNK